MGNTEQMDSDVAAPSKENASEGEASTKPEDITTSTADTDINTATSDAPDSALSVVSTPPTNEDSRKRKADDTDLPEGGEDEEGHQHKKPATGIASVPATPAASSAGAADTPGPCTAVPATTPGIDPKSTSRIKSCLVEGCEKLRAKSGYCLRHFKDKTAPIRSGTPEYERRICVIDGCERLRSKGEHCHRHHKDPNAPIRNKSDKSTDRKKKCSIENCDRLQVKGGFCSRHFRNRSAPVLTTPAFSFDADARWDELFPQLEAFYKKNGHSRVPTSQKTDLARFVVHIRCVYRTKKQKMLKADLGAAVSAAVFPEGSANVNDLGDSVEKAVVADPGAVAEDSHPDLTKSKLLTPERMEALKTVSFEFQLWTVEPSQWEQRFQELLAYKTDHGHFHVTNKQNVLLTSLYSAL
mmetsp:Transcript_18520/g.38932  ORF Transcript_18520/g.38932 Transcript_18520/m.38932 type:complete len:411 (+) Transcript_18520:469-1701(+)